MNKNKTAGNSELKPLPALDYRRNILASNEHSASRANSFRNFGNGSSSQNVMAHLKRQKKVQ